MQHSMEFGPELRSHDHDAEDLTYSLSFFFGLYLALIFNYFCSSAREIEIFLLFLPFLPSFP